MTDWQQQSGSPVHREFIHRGKSGSGWSTSMVSISAIETGSRSGNESLITSRFAARSWDRCVGLVCSVFACLHHARPNACGHSSGNDQCDRACGTEIVSLFFETRDTCTCVSFSPRKRKHTYSRLRRKKLVEYKNSPPQGKKFPRSFHVIYVIM